jgi:hypothetical protein
MIVADMPAPVTDTELPLATEIWLSIALIFIFTAVSTTAAESPCCIICCDSFCHVSTELARTVLTMSALKSHNPRHFTARRFFCGRSLQL